MATIFFCKVSGRADLSFSTAELNVQVNRNRIKTNKKYSKPRQVQPFLLSF